MNNKKANEYYARHLNSSLERHYDLLGKHRAELLEPNQYHVTIDRLKDQISGYMKAIDRIEKELAVLNALPEHPYR